MKIIINNHTKDLTDATCIEEAYELLTNWKNIIGKKEVYIFTRIEFVRYKCIVRHLKNGYSFEFKEKEQI